MPLADLRIGLRQFLLADTSISTAVGGTRIFPTVLQQGVRQPSIVYNRISSGPGDYTLQAPTGLVQHRYQIDAYAQTPNDADSLARLVKERIDGYRGLMGDVTVQGVQFIALRDDYQADVDLHRMSQDFYFWFEER